LNIIGALEESFNIVFDLFGIGKTATPPGNIINELRTDGLESMTILNKLSGKALTVQDSSDKEGVHIQQATRNDAAHQRWYLRRARFIRFRSISRVVDREVLQYWQTILRVPQVGYSIVTDHSGQCLDLPNGATDNSVTLHQLPANARSQQMWAIIPDHQGFNFIVNLHNGQLLDVADSSFKNYAPVRNYPFNGGDSQRWQLLA
jgi:arabinan endo-1,5-alpha-L-arabinosidase